MLNIEKFTDREAFMEWLQSLPKEQTFNYQDVGRCLIATWAKQCFDEGDRFECLLGKISYHEWDSMKLQWSSFKFEGTFLDGLDRFMNFTTLNKLISNSIISAEEVLENQW